MDHAIAHHSGNHYLPQATDAATARAEGLPGCWKLGADRALTLHARQAGVLRIAHGRVWVTFNNAGRDLRVRAGDHFLSRGESLTLSPGETVVMESFGMGHASSAYFNWEPTAATHSVPAKATGWRAGVVQPLLDLRLALGLVGGAVGRLARGLAGGVAAAVEVALTGFAVVFLAARARGDLAERAFNAQSSDKRAHCSIS